MLVVAVLTLSTSSPSCSLSAEDLSAPFQIIITLRLENSTQPGRAITIRTGGTVSAPSPEGGGLDILALGTFCPLISNSDAEKRIDLGQMKPHYLYTGEGPSSPNLKEREGIHFLNVPANSTVQVRHNLPLSRIFEYEDTLTKDDLKPGDVYHLGINSGNLGTTWWCWGDMEDNPKDQKLSACQEGSNFGKAEKPKAEQVGKEGWVLG
ncbi:MAG: hypothetical protein Q9198_006028 [Flavoplaca austrocitrina]